MISFFKSIYLWFPCFVAFFISWMRCWNVEVLARNYLQRSNTFLFSSLVSEAMSLGIFLAIYALAQSAKTYFISWVLRSVAFLLLFWMAVDMFVFHMFWKRIDFSDVSTFSQEYSANFAILLASMHRENAIQLALLVLVIFMLIYWNPGKSFTKKNKFYLLSLSGFFLVLSQSGSSVDSVMVPQIVNTISYNLNYGVRPAYSREYLNDVRDEISSNSDHPSCIPGENLRRNLILIIVESLSSYQSKNLSGLNDWTPGIDELSKKGLVSINFIANGFRTDLGLISTLTGHWPIIPSQKGVEPYDAFYALTDSLPMRLSAKGYQTSFISGSPLSFLKSKEWLHSIGFQETIGPEENTELPKRGEKFKDVFDEDLYQFTLNKIKSKTDPFFQVVVTISSHPPYKDPISGEVGEQAAFRYADRSFLKFYRDLENSGYFNRGGIVAVLGDHRALVPISQVERNIFQESASARVPFIVFGLDKKKYSINSKNDFLQQTDIPPSFEYLLSDKSCFKVGQNNIFASDERPPQCALHVRGDVAKYMTLFCDGQAGSIEVNGDKSKIVGVSSPSTAKLLTEIARSSARLGISADRSK